MDILNEHLQSFDGGTAVVHPLQESCFVTAIRTWHNVIPWYPSHSQSWDTGLAQPIPQDTGLERTKAYKKLVRLVEYELETKSRIK